MLTADHCASAWATLHHRHVSTSQSAAPLPAQMRPVLRRPPPGATDVLAKLAPWFPGGFPPSRADFAAPAQPLDRGQMGAPLREPALRSGGRLAVFRHRLAEANQYVRVRSTPLLGRLLTDMNSSKGAVRWRETSSFAAAAGGGQPLWAGGHLLPRNAAIVGAVRIPLQVMISARPGCRHLGFRMGLTPLARLLNPKPFVKPCPACCA